MRCTKFFHSMARSQSSVNHLEKLHIGGEDVMGEDALRVKIPEFYMAL